MEIAPGPRPLGCLFRPKKMGCFPADETVVGIEGEEAWIWVAYEPPQRRLLALDLCWTRSSLSAELFLQRLVKRYGRHPVYTDGPSGTQRAAGAWACPTGPP